MDGKRVDGKRVDGKRVDGKRVDGERVDGKISYDERVYVEASGLSDPEARGDVADASHGARNHAAVVRRETLAWRRLFTRVWRARAGPGKWRG